MRRVIVIEHDPFGGLGGEPINSISIFPACGQNQTETLRHKKAGGKQNVA